MKAMVDVGVCMVARSVALRSVGCALRGFLGALPCKGPCHGMSLFLQCCRRTVAMVSGVEMPLAKHWLIHWPTIPGVSRKLEVLAHHVSGGVLDTIESPN